MSKQKHRTAELRRRAANFTRLRFRSEYAISQKALNASLRAISDCGYEEGSVCGRNGCSGVIEIMAPDNCSCHVCPPCASCVAPREFCPECDWRAKDEEVVNNHVVQVNPKTGTWKLLGPRPLDPSKIDYHVKSHTHFTQICEGVYPPGTTMDDVLQRVRGTFGGRFEHFANGKFRYVAYTD